MAPQADNDQLVQLFEQLRRFFDRHRQKRGTGFLIMLGILIVIGGWILITGLYVVDADEIAVVQRFGKYNRQATPGLHFKLPDGIESRTNVKVAKVFTEEFGFRTQQAATRTSFKPEEEYENESLMLTGDLNCALIPWIVQFRVRDPVEFLFNVRDPVGTLRDMSEAMMRQVVGDRSIDEIISRRAEIANKAQELLQQALNQANTGINVVNVELKNTTVPKPVQPSFNEVNEAAQQKQQMINQAKADFNRVIPAARGKAEQVVQQAHGYAKERVNEARGDSARFVALYNEYRKAPAVTRERLYLETMNDVLPRMGKKYIVDSEQKNFLPLLNMNSARRK